MGRKLASVLIVAFICALFATRSVSAEDPSIHDLVANSSLDAITTGLEDADIEARDANGDTPLCVAVKKQRTPVVDLLLEHGANPNAADKHGLAPLYYAAGLGNLEIMNLLIQREGDVAFRDTDGRSLLHIAAAMDFAPGLRRLLQLNLDPEMQDNYGNTPLHLSARFFRGLVTANALLENGVEVNANNNESDTPLHLALRDDSNRADLLPVFATLLALRAREKEAGYAARHRALFLLLLEKGADIEAQNDRRRTALHLAAMLPEAQFARELIRRGASPDTPDENENTPLILSFVHANLVNDPSLTIEMIQDTTRINARNQHRQTALHYAAGFGDARVVEALLAAGADRNVVDDSGDTPLEIAENRGLENVARLLK